MLPLVVYVILALVFAVFVALFAVQNATQITVTFLAWQWNTSVAVVILGAAAFGAAFGGLLALVREIQLKLKLRGAQGQVRRLETLLEEVEAARTKAQELSSKAGSVTEQQ
ncbi:MAG: DUF1049 domain-containing protein [Firmicutes bacterium]|nr:DUF1049 domain-containing protein [Bacillota bacterium]